MDKHELQKLRDLPIEGVAQRLGLHVARHKSLCPFHDDHSPSLSISPDGKKVVFLTFRKGDLEPWQHLPEKQVQLWLMNPDGSDVRPIVSLFGGQGTINVNSWAPDSTRFAYIRYRKDDDA